MQNSFNDTIPVYLITGFLESGKTSFIQETLEDPQFDNGDETLLILCEEGETEPDLSKVNRSPVTLRTIEDEEELTPALLESWEQELRPDRVMLEYNGMWQMKTLLEALPRTWMVQQKFCFADARSFLNYNANMRSLVFDKLQNCDMVVFNRFNTEEDVMPYHKIVRAINRAAGIVYEAPNGAIRYDEIQDPLPFDKNAKIIDIADRDFAIWYQDLNEALRSYDGKTVHFKAQVSKPSDLEQGASVVGRHMMNCCAADISFVGMIAVNTPAKVATGDWVDVTGSIKVKRHKGYSGATGPVLNIRRIEPAQPPEDLVATFY